MTIDWYKEHFCGRESWIEPFFGLGLGIWQRFGHKFDRRGTNIFERQWDVLIVLDSCRYDLLAEVADEYAFLSKQTIWSSGGTSSQWIDSNFNNDYYDEMEDSIYVTGNVHSDTSEKFDRNDLMNLDHVWKYAWSDETGTVPAKPMTDRAITNYRQNSPERMVVHYMQPHYPFLPDPITDGMDISEFEENDKSTTSPWDMMKEDELTQEEVWPRYRKSLEYVLESVTTLLNNINADKVIITADHGNAMGEYGVYGHQPKVPIPSIKRVPWCVTSAQNTEHYEPSNYDTKNESITQKEALQSLGYLQ